MNAGELPPGDGYMTRGRAAAYERRLAGIQATFDERSRGLERRIVELERQQAELPRAIVAAMLDVVRRNGAAGVDEAGIRGVRG